MGLEAFGRAGARDEGYAPCDLGCADCRGVLYVTELGKQGFVSFRCRVGHVYSADSLMEFKEDRLDEALWTAVELLDEIIQLRTVLAVGEKSGGARRSGVSTGTRITRAARHRELLRELIRDEGPEPLEGGKGGKPK